VGHLHAFWHSHCRYLKVTPSQNYCPNELDIEFWCALIYPANRRTSIMPFALYHFDIRNSIPAANQIGTAWGRLNHIGAGFAWRIRSGSLGIKGGPTDPSQNGSCTATLRHDPRPVLFEKIHKTSAISYFWAVLVASAWQCEPPIAPRWMFVCINHFWEPCCHLGFYHVRTHFD